MRGTVRDVPLGQTSAAGSAGRPGQAGARRATPAAAASVQQVGIDEDDLAHRVLALFWRDLERNMRIA